MLEVVLDSSLVVSGFVVLLVVLFELAPIGLVLQLDFLQSLLVGVHLSIKLPLWGWWLTVCNLQRSTRTIIGSCASVHKVLVVGYIYFIRWFVTCGYGVRGYLQNLLPNSSQPGN